MKTNKFKEVSSDELLKEIKKLKTNKIINAVVIGFSVGVMIYSAINNGFSLFTFFPLLVVYLIVRNLNKNKIAVEEMQDELRSRSL